MLLKMKGNDQTIPDQDKVKKEPESVLGVAKEKWKQPACYQKKVKKEPENDIEEEQVSSVKKVKRKTMPDNVPAPSATKDKRGRQ